MRRKYALLSAFLLALIATPSLADIASIHAASLPQESAVLAALDDIREIEPYVSAWTNNWKYPVAKKDASDRLKKDLRILTAALQSHPDNAELALLTGLVAHYAYNLDLPDAHEKATAAFDQARNLAPGDFRISWFHADLLCQTLDTKPGADEFLAIEAAHPWNELPAAFWGDYMYCATVTNMPAHVLRAASYLDKLDAPSSETRTFLVDNARKRFDAFDPNKKYDPKETWTSSDVDTEPIFTSTSCGVRLTVHGNWTINQLALSNGSCVAYFSTGPYKATTRNLQPSILLMVQRPGAGETLEDYVKKFAKDGTFEPFTPSRCPAAACVALKGVQPGMYKADGDGHGHFLGFERDEPAFPGLIFESPLVAPKPSKGGTPQYFRPSQIQKRIPGKLFYLVLVDVADSIEAPAMSDYDFFLKNLTAE